MNRMSKERDAKQETTSLDDEATEVLMSWMQRAIWMYEAAVAKDGSGVEAARVGNNLLARLRAAKSAPKQETTSLDDEAIACVARLAAFEKVADKDNHQVSDILQRIEAARKVQPLRWQREKPTEPCWCVAARFPSDGFGKGYEVACELYLPCEFPINTRNSAYLPIPTPTEETVGGFPTPEQMAKSANPQPAEVELTRGEMALVNGSVSLKLTNGDYVDYVDIETLIRCIDEWKRRNNA